MALNHSSILEEIACRRLINNPLRDGCIRPSGVDLCLPAPAEVLFGSRELASKNQRQTEPIASRGYQDLEPRRDVRQKPE